MEKSSKLHVAMLSSPGMGHVIPVLVLGNRLATIFDVKVTIIVPTTSSSSDEELRFVKAHKLSRYVDVIGLPPVDISAKISPTAGAITRLCTYVREAVPCFKSTLASMDRRPDALIFDIFCLFILPFARELEIPAYLYVTTNVWATALFVYSHVLDKEIEGQYVDQIDPLVIPGCKSVRPEELPDPLFDRNDREYYEYVQLGGEFCKSDGILINTWENLEPIALEGLRRNEILRSLVKIPIYPIGPLTRPAEPVSLENEMFKWLDRQPDDSVIFLCFGSGGVLSASQINELALGLELSQQRFVWVVRPPRDGGLKQPSSNDRDDLDFLPDGFLNRTCDLGFVVLNWAQQVEILDHPAIGGFLSHCGWNSTLEGICADVPMIAWPLYAEQRMNAVILTEDIGVAIRPEVLPTKKVVGREEIEKMVRKLMQDREGQVMREKMKKLKFSADNALNKGGPSFNSLSKILEEVRSHKFN